jgi:hypothetical protein
MEDLPKIVRSRLESKAPETHPDPDILTAFSEQVLSEFERKPVLAHLAQCSECREVAALSLPTLEVQEVLMVKSAPAWGWPQMVRWGSLFACLVIVGAAVLIHKPTPVAVRPSSESEVVVPESDRVPTALDKKKETVAEAVAAAQSVPAANVPSDEVRQHTAVVQSRKQIENLRSEPKPIAPMATAPPTADVRIAVAGKSENKMMYRSVPATAGTIGGPFQKPSASAPVPAAPPASGLKNAVVDVDASNVSSESAADRNVSETPGRAKVGTAAGATDAPAPQQPEPSEPNPLAKAVQVNPAGGASLAHIPTQWTLSPEGQLQRSFDMGKTWGPVPVIDRAKFTAFSVVGLEVWVGGEGALLYHSADNGRKWTLMNPKAGGVALKADISALNFSDPQRGVMTTSDGQEWTTADGGWNWQKKP